MNAILTAVDGNKTYIAAALGAIVIIANHFGVQVPGVNLNPQEWLNDLWGMLLLATGRSALAKVTK